MFARPLTFLSAEEEFRYDTIVVGAGPSGLASAFCLEQNEVRYLVLEGSSQVVKSWHEVWDGFRLAQPVSEVTMPGLNLEAFDPHHHLARNEIIKVFEKYAVEHELKIKFNTKVISVKKNQDDTYHVVTDKGNYTAENVILSVGARQQPRFPSCVDKIPEEIRKAKIMHSAWYKSDKHFSPYSEILVVGSGRSALGIAEELTHQHKVTLSCKYTDVQIQKNNSHLQLGVTLEKLVKSHVQIVGELDDVSDEKAELHFRNQNETVHLHRYEKVICATGFKTSYELLNQLLAQPVPEHNNGVTMQPGLYLVGIPKVCEKTVTITKGGQEAKNAVSDIKHRQQQKVESSLRKNSVFRLEQVQQTGECVAGSRRENSF